MLKTLATLMRGLVADNEAAVIDANAVALLRQQVREAATAMEAARRELAVAVAFETAERRALEALSRRSEETEAGARKALADGHEDLARDAARLIAALEDERIERDEAMTGFARDIARLRTLIDAGRERLRELDRGFQVAKVNESLRRAGAHGRRSVAASDGALRQAEGTLARIKARDAHEADASAALAEIESEPADVERRLDAMGYGPRRRTNPDDVLARLKAA